MRVSTWELSFSLLDPPTKASQKRSVTNEKRRRKINELGNTSTIHHAAKFLSNTFYLVIWVLMIAPTGAATTTLGTGIMARYVNVDELQS